MKKTLKVLALAATILALGSSQARAALVIEFDEEFSGASDPAGTPPWLVATFTTSGVDTVTLTLDASGLVGVEKVTEWNFNLDPNLDVTSLVFTPVDNDPAYVPPVGLGANAFQADGGGLYDIQINYLSGPPAATFGPGDIATFTITGIAGLDETDFNFIAAQGGGNEVYVAAAHVQGIGTSGEGSGWIGGTPDDDEGDEEEAVPEPATLALMGIALAGLAHRARRRA